MLEVRNDLKGMPTKDDYDKMESRIRTLEESRIRDGIKIGIASGIMGIIAGLAIKFLMG